MLFHVQLVVRLLACRHGKSIAVRYLLENQPFQTFVQQTLVPQTSQNSPGHWTLAVTAKREINQAPIRNAAGPGELLNRSILAANIVSGEVLRFFHWSNPFVFVNVLGNRQQEAPMGKRVSIKCPRCAAVFQRDAQTAVTYGATITCSKCGRSFQVDEQMVQDLVLGLKDKALGKE